MAILKLIWITAKFCSCDKLSINIWNLLINSWMLSKSIYEDELSPLTTSIILFKVSFTSTNPFFNSLLAFDNWFSILVLSVVETFWFCNCSLWIFSKELYPYSAYLLLHMSLF
uniref:Uncharacterized protein n=1 Tax=Cantharellus cibarius TaxID=36066 RepID=M1JZB2_CANCI|nr:hypothetical protein H915_mgp20 [Cantharellus cibarius]AGE93547.1 hypothetical protein [Cantharellus cibarius]